MSTGRRNDRHESSSRWATLIQNVPDDLLDYVVNDEDDGDPPLISHPLIVLFVTRSTPGKNSAACSKLKSGRSRRHGREKTGSPWSAFTSGPTVSTPFSNTPTRWTTKATDRHWRSPGPTRSSPDSARNTGLRRSASSDRDAKR
jgi:hypothetical protein